MKSLALVDLQVNGCKGVDFSGPELTEDSFTFACRELIKAGTTAFLPTMITSPAELYQRNLPIMTKVMQKDEFKHRLLGFHIEGPFLNPTDGARGAHNPDWILPCNINFLKEIIQLSKNNVKLLTIAADSEGAAGLTEFAVSQSITVSLGHHMANENDLQKLVKAGAKALTHLGNGVPLILPRHNNPLWASLANDSLTAMIVTDGHHLPPPVIKTIIRTKTPARCIVVSDASPLAGMPPGKYTTLGNEVVLEENGRLHNPKAGHLVGSSATMTQCIQYLVSLNLLTPDELTAVAFHNPLKLIDIDPAKLRLDT